MPFRWVTDKHQTGEWPFRWVTDKQRGADLSSPPNPHTDDRLERAQARAGDSGAHAFPGSALGTQQAVPRH